MYKKHKQHRLYGYDYSSNGYYFVTIVTNGRIHYFGKIVNHEMHLSDIGRLVQKNIKLFHRLKNGEPDPANPYLQNESLLIMITEHVIMPNHIHMIVEILNKNTLSQNKAVTGLSPLTKGSLSSFINHFKGKIKRQCNENGYEFNWQSRFHDRIIRNNEELNRIIIYIQNNIINWKVDKENI